MKGGEGGRRGEKITEKKMNLFPELEIILCDVLLLYF